MCEQCTIRICKKNVHRKKTQASKKDTQNIRAKDVALTFISLYIQKCRDMAQTGVDRLNKTATENVIVTQHLRQNSRQFNNAGISDTSKNLYTVSISLSFSKTYFAHKLDKLRL